MRVQAGMGQHRSPCAHPAALGFGDGARGRGGGGADE